MTRLRPKRVRARLTLWYLVVLAGFLALYAGGSSTLLRWSLRSQLNQYAKQDLETIEGLLSFDSQGRILFKDDYHNHPESKLVQERYLEVLSGDGRTVLYRNARLGSRSLGKAAFQGEGQGGYSERNVRLDDGTHILLVSRQHTMDGRGILIRLAYSEEPLRQQFHELLIALVLAFPAVLAGAGTVGYFLARRILLPLEQMAGRAAQMTPDHLDERLPVQNVDDELGQLASIFNGLLEQLENSFERLSRFTSDASHELRTPLACIRSVGEVSLQKDITPKQYREAIGSMLEEVERLTSLVDHLLALSRGDAEKNLPPYTPMPIEQPIKEAMSLLEVLMEEKALRVEVDIDPNIVVEADPVLLRQAFVNLLHNAVKYSPPGGIIRIGGHAKGGKVSVTISDQGEGIDEENRERVFERFFRVDAARSRQSGGTGLGLAIVKWTVEVHKGTVTLEPSSGKGSVFRVELPAKVL
jgi:heavy metal sensor kinase